MPIGAGEGAPGERIFMGLGGGLNRAQASEADPPSMLTWETEPPSGDLDVLATWSFASTPRKRG